MYEEDRQRALQLYEEIFDEAGNENAVLQLVVSPTRQAVNLARAYDGKDRRGQANDGEMPAYLQVIDDLRRQAGTLMPPVPAVNDDQLSLFEQPDVAETVFDSLKLGKLPEEEEEDLPEAMSEGIGLYPDEDRSNDAVPPRPAPATVPPAEDAPSREVDDFSDAVEAFLAGFAIRTDDSGENGRNTPPAVGDEQESLPERAPVPMTAVDRHDEDRQLPAETNTTARARSDEKPSLPGLPAETEKKPNVALLILYILFAVPITLLLICLLLVPAALCLVLAALGLAFGFAGLVEAFTAFSVFADILLVFGLSLALAAIGLLLFWCFVSLLFSAIPGLIRGACRLARKLCYKEAAK